jgi:hypothetical protein
MKTNNKTLVYDDACPMCAWYTGAFVKSGLLSEEGRKAFSNANPELLHDINWQRSKNEIPLIDTNTKQVWYGIDALLEILGQKVPLIKTIGKFTPVNWSLKRLYNFISYNRKVIVATKSVPGTIDCTPDFNVFYRILFMLVFLSFNTLMLFPTHSWLARVIPFYHLSVAQLQLAHTIFVVTNCLLASLSLPGKKTIEYLGQINMLALVTTLLMIPFMLINKAVNGSEWFSYGYLAALTIFVIREYYRRMEYVSFIFRYKWVMIGNLLCVSAFMAYLFII